MLQKVVLWVRTPTAVTSGAAYCGKLQEWDSANARTTGSELYSSCPSVTLSGSTGVYQSLSHSDINIALDPSK